MLTLSLMTGCDTRKPETTTPSLLLPENKMVEIMIDVNIIESAINHRKGANHRVLNLRQHAFDSIFAHYGITDSIFYENVNYYNSDPIMMKNIMDSVNSFFEKKKIEMDKIYKDKKKKD